MTVFLIIAAAILVIVLQLLLQRRQAGKLKCDVYPDTDQAEPDEKFYIHIRIENPSWVIYPFVRFGIILPKDINVHAQMKTANHPPYSIEVSGSAVLFPHRTLEKKIQVSAPVRGAYRLGSFYVETGDFVGLEEYRQDFVRFNTVAVFPRPLQGVEEEEILGSLIGDISVRRFIHEDPVINAGFREYSGREPMKAISWLQTARTGQLIVKKYDFTSDPSVSVLLDCECESEELSEKCFSLARSVCDALEEKGIEYDFFMNPLIGGVNCRQHYFSRGLGRLHQRAILKQLAMATYSCEFSGEELIGKALDSSRTAPGLIFISACRSEAKSRMISRLAADPAITVREMYAEDHIENADGANEEREVS